VRSVEYMTGDSQVAMLNGSREVSSSHEVQVQSTTSCRRCGAKANVIKAWDGKHYCKLCITAVSHRLERALIYATVFEETMPFSMASGIPKALYYSGSIAIVFGLFALIGAISGDISWMHALLFTVICLVVGSAKAIVDVTAIYYGRHSIVFYDGKVLVKYGVPRRQAICPLMDIVWDYGLEHEVGNKLGGSSVPIIVVSFPIDIPSPMVSLNRLVGCGWTSETKETLVAFFTLADVPRGRRDLIGIRKGG